LQQSKLVKKWINTLNFRCICLSSFVSFHYLIITLWRFPPCMSMCKEKPAFVL
jgi:hypothetical protein